MQGVGPGSLLAGRYALRDRLTQRPGWERWSAVDTDLGRDVVLLCFPSAAPHAAAAVDAARRAAAVEDSGLTRLLDIRDDAGVTFVVEEATPGATSFTALAKDGGLPATEVRHVVAEAAEALAKAWTRGLHHGVLTPRDVLVLPDGSVKVRGLATQAALLGEEDRPADEVSRADAVALVGLLYAGLTGRWPLPGVDAGLQAAPRVPSGVVAPSQIVAAVPADIDALVTRTLHGDDGPATPDEVAEELFPGRLRHARRVPPTASAFGSPPSRTRPMPAPGLTGSGGVATAGRTSTGAATRSSGRQRGNGASTTGGGLLVERRGRAVGSDSASPSGGAPSTVGATLGVAAGAAKSAAERLGGAVEGLGATASTVAGRVGRATKLTVERGAARSFAWRRRARHDDRSDELSHAQNARLSDVLEETDERLEPPVPIALVHDADIVPNREQSKLALGIVAAFVVVAAVLGVWGLPSIGGVPSAQPVIGTTTSSPPSPPSTPTSTTAAPTPSSGEPTPVAIVRAAGFEPTNGGQVASSTAGRAYDADPETSWQSKWFATAQFGGLPIEGIGLVADLGQATDIRRVTLQLPVKQDGTVYVANRASLSGAKPLGSFTDQEGTVVLDAASGALNGQLVIVYVTRLGPDGQGRFRAQVSELEVSG